MNSATSWFWRLLVLVCVCLGAWLRTNGFDADWPVAGFIVGNTALAANWLKNNVP